MSEETEQEMPEARIADQPIDPIEVLKAEIESLRDQRLRALAEAENIRRRAEREKTEASLYAVTKFARDMLSIADNFARALAACPPEVRDAADPQVKAVLDGIEAQQFTGYERMQEMPGFADKLSDAEIADLSNYVRVRFAGQPASVTADGVAKLRQKATAEAKH